MPEPEVSVLVVAYNQGRFIEACLRSILAQDHPDFEVVVTDDASTDDTVAVARRLAKEHPNVRVLAAERNGGVTVNGNRGLRACRGRFVAALGGDDLAYPGKLSAQATLLRDHPDVAVVYHDMEVFHDDGSEPASLFSAFRRPREGTAKDLVRNGNFIVGSSPMFRRSAMPAGLLPEEIPVVSDWYFNIAVAREGRIAYIPKALGGYRRHTDSVLVRKLGRSDPLLTLDLVSQRFPELARHARWRRGELLRQEARRAVREDPARSARLARQALRQRQAWSPRELAWLLLVSTDRLASQRRARAASASAPAPGPSGPGKG
ncbi:MAG: hypothetical protein QOJ26_673 [Thermoplasmata archaeon]|nr:hypothetical protein [Thermoplasmata archaeon]